MDDGSSEGYTTPRSLETPVQASHLHISAVSGSKQSHPHALTQVIRDPYSAVR